LWFTFQFCEGKFLAAAMIGTTSSFVLFASDFTVSEAKFEAPPPPTLAHYIVVPLDQHNHPEECRNTWRHKYQPQTISFIQN
jgi:hypothetical protein